MTRYTGLQIRDAAIKAGFASQPIIDVGGARYSPADVMAAIALGESGGDNQATANTSAEYSVGVYQINLKAHPDIAEADARDLNASSLYVYRLSQGGGNFTPWTIYKNGSYKNHLPLAGGSTPAPVSPGVDPHDPNAPSGVQEAGTILGITPPSAEEWKRAGLLLAAAMTGIFLVVVSVGAWVKEPITTVAKAAI